MESNLVVFNCIQNIKKCLFAEYVVSEIEGKGVLKGENRSSRELWLSGMIVRITCYSPTPSYHFSFPYPT